MLRIRGRRGKICIKKILLTIVSLAVLGIIIFLIVIFTDFNARSEAGQKSDTAVTSMNDVKDEAKSEVSKHMNPFGDSVQQKELKDKDFINYIHKMSHQKVSAEEKWGFYQITAERIKWLLAGLDKTEHTLKHGELYRSILKRWINGDFSNVVNDHNDLWEIQGGGVLAKPQES
ncbi:DUF6241 domain-containing protein [Virgibacillus halophilus]|uniref:DUF6241 domain-containing protein n=1 Tax=Tigheibacillus halophilus TaxID=361280 RepID=A0ABU5C234_9BACI|nr:DUF6241 domain-containing protein [Virgibacillus halophilus]